MPRFALLFRPTRAVPPDQLPVRNAAARAWALDREREGALAYASPLEDEGTTVTSAGATPYTRDGAVAAVLIVEAADLQRATELARTHPGLAYGTQIEVRPVKPGGPRPPPR